MVISRILSRVYGILGGINIQAWLLFPINRLEVLRQNSFYWYNSTNYLPHISTLTLSVIRYVVHEAGTPWRFYSCIIVALTVLSRIKLLENNTTGTY